ncbi:uncharacterized protein KY384_004835 [Bacidia gigantensis]|uniref:uncharacterized protein n=1 Tax=Bacidia gigantensis TaxID=2732470 RepID=UPI001D044B9F|nr:uncharacterized protein KY384_004835 [Bacidia gigantensis]KAG8530333.1 hypothetical protein KY384_004835 [Bacidia gigantensis]
MSRESSSTSYNNRASSSRTNTTHAPLPSLFSNIRIPSFRQNSRDGYDMRRPVMSQQPSLPQNVIDLTEEPSSPPEFALPPERTPDPLLRRPNGPRRSLRHHSAAEPQVVDLSDAESAPSSTEGPSSPEIEFISSRARSRSPEVNQNQYNGGPRQSHRVNQHPRPYNLPSIFNFGLGANLAHFQNRIGQVRDQLVGIDYGVTEHFNIPNMLDVSAVGFNLDRPQQLAEEPRLPTYEAPDPPRRGYTRNSKKDQILVCPKCEGELGAGDGDLKRQVWVSRPCGHVRIAMAMVLTKF